MLLTTRIRRPLFAKSAALIAAVAVALSLAPTAAATAALAPAEAGAPITAPVWVEGPTTVVLGDMSSIFPQMPPGWWPENAAGEPNWDSVFGGYIATLAKVTPAVPTTFRVLHMSDGVVTNTTELGSSTDGATTLKWYDGALFIDRFEEGRPFTLVFEATNAAGSTRSDAARPESVPAPAPAPSPEPAPETPATPGTVGEQGAPTPTPTPTPGPVTPPKSVLKSTAGPATLPVITSQPTHAVGEVNKTVTLSLGVADPAAATVTWFIRTKAEENIALGTSKAGAIDLTIKLLASYSGQPFWAEVSNGAGTIQSNPAVFAIVTQPKIIVPLRTVPLYPGEPEAVPFAAEGGHDGLAQLVPFVTRVGTGEPWSGQVSTTVTRGSGKTMLTTASALFTSDDQGEWQVEWKTCVLVPGSTAACPQEVKGVALTEAKLTVAELAAPVLITDLRELTLAEKDSSVTLAVEVAPSLVAPTFRWEYSTDGTEWHAVPGVSSSAYTVGNATAANGRRYRVTVTNAADSVTSTETQVRAVKKDYYTPGGGFAPLVFANLAASEDGNLPLVMVDWSTAAEVPKDYLVLPTGAEVSTGWHWSHLYLNEWFDLKIGDSGWNVLVRYDFYGVSCQFYPTAAGTWVGHLLLDRFRFSHRIEDRSDVDKLAPFACQNGKGDNHFVGPGTADADSILKLVNKTKVNVKPEKIGELASYACASRFATCPFEGTRSDGPSQVNQVFQIGMNCSAVENALTSHTLSTHISVWDIWTWNDWQQHGGGFQFRFGTKTEGLTVSTNVYYEHNQGGSTAKIDTDRYTVTENLLPGQIGYVSVTTPSVKYSGDVDILLGGHTYSADKVEYTTNDPGVVTGKTFSKEAQAPYGLNTSTMVRQMTKVELDACRAAMPQPPQPPQPEPEDEQVPGQGTGSVPEVLNHPQNVVGLLNGSARLSVQLEHPTDQLVWYYGGDRGKVRLGSGNDLSIVLTNDLDGREYWAEIGGGDEPQVTARGLIVLVSKPKILIPTGTAPLYVAPNEANPPMVQLAAEGGSANVARVIPFITNGRVTLPFASLEAKQVDAESTSMITHANVKVGVPGQWTVVWKTCVMVPDATELCPVEVAGASISDSSLTVRTLARPVLLNDRESLITAPPGSGVTLTVKTEPSPRPLTIEWQYSEDKVTWKTLVTGESSAYWIQNVSQSDRHWYRAVVSNAVGTVPGAPTQVRSMVTDYQTPGGGFAPLTFMNLAAGPNGNLPLTLTASSGAAEMPKGYLELATGGEVTTSWHWSHLALNEWFDLKIGDTGWNVRVQYLYGGVDCRFFKDGTDPSTGTVFNFDYRCMNGKRDNHYVGRGTADADSVLMLMNLRPVKVKDEYLPLLAELACSNPKVSCAFEGVTSGGPAQISHVVNPGPECSAVAKAPSARTLMVEVGKWNSVTWSNTVGFNLGAEWEWSFGELWKFRVSTKHAYENSKGRETRTFNSDTYATTVHLSSGQVGYVAVYTPTVQWDGDVVIEMGGHIHRAPGISYTTSAPGVGEGGKYDRVAAAPYDLKTATYIRQMTPVELAACRSQFQAGGS